MKLRLLAGTVLLAAMTLSPTAMAVHGSSYTAEGFAYLSTGTHTPPLGWLGPLSVPVDTQVYKATVVWTGFNPPAGLPYNHYKVVVNDMETGQVMVNALFPGSETWGCCVVYNTEFFQYHGCSSLGGWGSPCVDSPNDFDVYGIQAIHVPTARTFMLYEGWYNNWALYLVVDGGFLPA